MSYCPYCNDDKKGIYFALQKSDIKKMYSGEELQAKQNNLVDHVLSGEKGTLYQYGIETDVSNCLRVLFREDEIPEVISDRISLRRATAADIKSGRVTVRGYAADILNYGGRPTPVTSIACGNCHLILPNTYAREDGIEDEKDTINISLISTLSRKGKRRPPSCSFFPLNLSKMTFCINSP